MDLGRDEFISLMFKPKVASHDQERQDGKVGLDLNYPRSERRRF